jgi:uncharacterized protein YgiM (DUF1202 family)
MFIILAVSCVQIYSQDAIVVSNANLRTEANIAAPKKALMPKGATVTIKDSADGWYVVIYKGLVGFVNAAYIKTKEDTDGYQKTTPTVSQPNNNGSVKYYTNKDGNQVQSPTKYDAAPKGATAVCMDDTYSFSRNRRGTCSRHGEVAKWLP